MGIKSFFSVVPDWKYMDLRKLNDYKFDEAEVIYPERQTSEDTEITIKA